jgi:RecG-like helicase
MKRNFVNPSALNHMTRLALGLVGVGLSLALMAAVLLLFAHASRTDWLVPTPYNLAGMQHCAASIVAVRQACVAAFVASAKQHDSTKRMAQDAVSADSIETNR